MKKTYALLLALLPVLAFCQQDSTKPAAPNQTGVQSTTPPPPAPAPKPPHRSLGLGIKAGLNFTNVTGTSSISNGNETGYQVGLFLDPSSQSILGSRTELVYSHQGYNYSTGQTTGKVFLDYIMLAQLMSINITHFFQIQIGTQFGYLINAKADSTAQSTGNVQVDQALSYYNRFIFGFSGGVEVRPFLGIIVGARYNLSLTNLYKTPDYSSGQVPPSFIPSTSDVNFKNNLVQVYVGYRF
jgi:hypothetical protein